MTKRRPKNAKPTGVNKFLGAALENKLGTRFAKFSNQTPYVTETTDKNDPSKVLASITHENEYQEFFNNAELAGRNFAAQKDDFKLLESTSSSAVDIEETQSKSFADLNAKYGQFLSIPRRPLKDKYSTAEELQAAENMLFIEWKRGLCRLIESDGVVLTPFERNLEVWRQLWRVIERSDIMVQIVDSRNPLLFRSADLEKYASEFDPPKKCVLLINKADLLSKEQIEVWKNYFVDHHIDFIFWSALSKTKCKVSEEEAVSEQLQKTDLDEATEQDDEELYVSDPNKLLRLLREAAVSSTTDKELVVAGFVGYPNVGKSSTINRILNAKRTSVSATPGKTKHFQTLFVDSTFMLCDCPGLVMPSLGFSSAEMLLNGILPVDQMKDCFKPIQLLCDRVTRQVFESLYSIMLPKPATFESEDKPVTAHELLTALAFVRGFMSAAGIPDCSRAARLIVKDVFNGKLKWVSAPPGFNQTEFNNMNVSDLPKKNLKNSGETLLTQLEKRNYLINMQSKESKLNANFFDDKVSIAHVRSVKDVVSDRKQHFKKRDKLRRIYRDLDA